MFFVCLCVPPRNAHTHTQQDAASLYLWGFGGMLRWSSFVPTPNPPQWLPKLNKKSDTRTQNKDIYFRCVCVVWGTVGSGPGCHYCSLDLQCCFQAQYTLHVPVAISRRGCF
eukprot:6463491-Amphidinium_carterae.1